jgi:hypothetical protein
MMRKAAFVLVGLALAATARAQDELPAYQQYPTGVGFAVGQISGTGLSYRHWFGQRLGIQVAAGGLYLPAEPGAGLVYSTRVLDYRSGIEVLLSLYATEFTRWLFGQVYLFGGVSHFGYVPWREVSGIITPLEGDPYEGVVGYERGAYVPGFALGGGVGIEIALFRHFSTAFELGYALFWEGIPPGMGEQLSLNLVPQGILQFRY